MALTFFPARAAISLSSFAVCCLFMKPLMIGFDPKVPLTGWRERTRKFLFSFFMRIIVVMAGMQLEMKEVDYDYSFYLGKDYKKE